MPEYPIIARTMSERLLIRLQPDGQLAWLALDAQGRALSGANAGAPPAQALEHAQRVVVLVPAEEVVLLDTPRLSVARTQLRKAVPFALEDQLASPVEELHFAVADRAIGTRIPVAVIAAATLRDWLARLARDGIKPDALFAETQALPCSDGVGSVLIEDGRALWRLAPAQAGTCDIAGLPDWLVLLVAGEGRAPAFEVHDFRDAPPLSLPRCTMRTRKPIPYPRPGRWRWRNRSVLIAGRPMRHCRTISKTMARPSRTLLPTCTRCASNRTKCSTGCSMH